MTRACIILLCLFAALVPAGAQSRSQQQKIERILELTNSDSIVAEVVAQVASIMQQVQPNPTAQQKARRQEALDKIGKLARERMLKFRPQLVAAYKETFSDEELDGMLTFYETPAGRAVATKIPAINNRMSGLVQAEMNALGPEINKIAEDALKK